MSESNLSAGSDNGMRSRTTSREHRLTVGPIGERPTDDNPPVQTASNAPTTYNLREDDASERAGTSITPGKRASDN